MPHSSFSLKLPLDGVICSLMEPSHLIKTDHSN